MKSIEKIIDALERVEMVHKANYNKDKKMLSFMVGADYFEIYIPDVSLCCFISDAIEELFDGYHYTDDNPYSYFVYNKLHEIVCKVQKVDDDDNDICYEWCPDCESESKIRNEFVLQKCEHCGRVILPCSLCKTTKCYDCPFDEKKIIEKLNNEPNIEEYNEMYCCDDRENIPQDILIAFDYIAENGIELYKRKWN
jgi:hypothetical protein